MNPAQEAQFSLDIEPVKKRSGVNRNLLVRLSPAVPSEVYETYWRFAAARQDVFFRRQRDEEPPWSDDPILQRFKFTNAYRASDRVSQFLIREVIYNGPERPEDQLFRVLLFKFFNRIETWQLLEAQLGTITWQSYCFDDFDRVLTTSFESGEKLYSGAYIIPSPGIYGSRRKHRNHLRLLEEMMAAHVPERLQECRRMQDAFDLLRSFPSIGDFLAYQYVTDLNYGTLTDFSESEFVVPGPGALDGIRKCFVDLGGLNPVDAVKFMADEQEREFEHLDIDFADLWGRRLQYIDCQNLFCEVDKYARVAHPTVAGISGRKRIKQMFRPSGVPSAAWYPPKWGINELAARESR